MNLDFDKEFVPSNDEIDFKGIYDFCIRNIYSFILFFIIFLIPSFARVFSIKPTYEGEFSAFLSQDQNVYISNENIIQIYTDKINRKNLSLIYESPYFLESVYKYAKNYKQESLSFNDWIQTHLTIDFHNESEVLIVSYKDSSKELVLEVLNQIKEKQIEHSRNILGKKYNIFDISQKGKRINNNSDGTKSVIPEDYLNKQEEVTSEIKYSIIKSPTIESTYYPNRSKELIFLLFISFMGTVILTLLKEKISGIIYSNNDLKRLIECSFSGIIYKSNPELSKKLLDTFFYEKIYSSKVGVIHLDSPFLKKTPNLDIFASRIIKGKTNIDISNITNIEEIENLIIFAEENKCKYEDVYEVNKFIKTFKSKLLGLIIIKN